MNQKLFYPTSTHTHTHTHTIYLSQVRAGRDESHLFSTLHSYLTDNEAVFKDYFREADVNKNGVLDHGEISGLVTQIPGLTLEEQ